MHRPISETFQHSADLVRRFDEGARLVVEHRLVAARSGTDRPRRPSPSRTIAHCSSVYPLAGFRAPEPGLLRRKSAPSPTPRSASVGRGSGPSPSGLIDVEDVEHRVEFGKRLLQHFRVRVGQFEVRTGEAQPTLGELGAEIFGGAQVADRAEVDACVAGSS